MILSGPSGSGKTTIVDRLLASSPVLLCKSVSATTRPARKGEVNGDHYYFLSRDEFERRLQAGEFIEWAEVHSSGNYYGTLKSELERAKQNGAWALLEIDVQGALQVMEKYPDAVSIFLKASSESHYEQRLRGRGTESEEVIRQRLDTARRELQSAGRYQYQVINDDLNRAVSEISDILSKRETRLHA